MLVKQPGSAPLTFMMSFVLHPTFSKIEEPSLLEQALKNQVGAARAKEGRQEKNAERKYLELNDTSL